ncbi:MAG: DNA gyrase subunit A, partial [Fibrobacter sp.]|nr:DNA gyrase subunit A [Fibrobacter sp.]
VRDGLKPVHRRVLFGMEELGLQHNKAPKKSARVVGDVIGKYHPHGDAAVYDSLVRMAQDFSMRYTMVNGQGNFGSVDGDPPAAMRYTECRMTALAEEMLSDLDKETVEFAPNYDDSLKEPSVLPSKVPFLLVNGTTGIAVGMATNMAPHNLSEVVNAINATIDNPEITNDDLFKILPGPDFPTGGIIYGRSGILEAYRTGRGKVIVRAKAEVIKTQNDREEIIITEIPYMVNKSSLLEKMADLVRQKTIEGISFIRDESDRSGMRIVVGIKKDDFGDVVLNQLYKYTMMQTTFGINNLALVNLQPRLLSLKEIISHFIDHRHEVVVRRTQFDLRKAQERAHILEGYKIALDNIDEIVALIKNSLSPEDAQIKLQERFGLSEIQSKAILDMRLQRLTGLERDKIEAEYNQLQILILDLKAILDSRDRRMQIIKEELTDLKNRYGDPRRTEIIDATSDVDIEDLIAEEDMVITMSHEGYIKRTSLNTYRSQGRGGKGVKGMDSKENDFITTLFVASTHAYILFFTNTGRCYWLKVYKIPETGRQSKGKPIINLIDLKPDEKIAAFVPVREFDNEHFIVAATEQGVINKQPLSAYSNIRRDGINAINLDDGDRLIECKLTSGSNDIILGTSSGQAVRFHESAVRELGRNTRGVKGITLRNDDKVVSMIIIINEDDQVLTVTRNGYGKKTPVADYRKTNRGGSGIINIKVTEKNGAVIALKDVISGSFDLMLVTRNGIIIRVDVNKISTIGRNTQGVKLISLDDDDEVIDITLCERDAEESEQKTEEIPEAIPEAIEAADAQESFNVTDEEQEIQTKDEEPEEPNE